LVAENGMATLYIKLCSIGWTIW